MNPANLLQLLAIRAATNRVALVRRNQSAKTIESAIAKTLANS